MTPARFILCIDRFDEPNGLIWCVRTKGKWLNVAAIDVQVPTSTVFKGPTARQPKAYLEGVGVVRQDGRALVITAQ